MDLKGLIFGYTPEPSIKLRSEFDVKIERKVNKTPVHFDARVKGHFVPKGGKAEFVADEIYVHGMPNVNLLAKGAGSLSSWRGGPWDTPKRNRRPARIPPRNRLSKLTRREISGRS